MRRLMLSLAVISMLGGCVYQKVDYLSRYKFMGKVFDNSSKDPINGASVFFVDKGLDEYWKSMDKPRKICESSSAGEIQDVFEYFWGTTKGTFRKKPSGDFIILINEEWV